MPPEFGLKYIDSISPGLGVQPHQKGTLAISHVTENVFSADVLDNLSDRFLTEIPNPSEVVEIKYSEPPISDRTMAQETFEEMVGALRKTDRIDPLNFSVFWVRIN